MKTKISFVVDRSYDFYMKAELLIYSLLKNTQYSEDDIVVHCVKGVEDCFTDFLEKKAISYIYIEPFLDGKFCNKIQQLSSFIGEDCNVILLDTDTYLLDHIEIRYPEKFAAKIVDGSFPSLKTIKKMYKKVGLTRPKTTNADCNLFLLRSNKTIEFNYNGGFYHIPKHLIEGIHQKRSHYAEILYKNKEIKSGHIDQVAMSMALVELNIDAHNLSSNQNYPLHISKSCRYENKSKPIKMIHYHRMLNDLGFLDPYSGPSHNAKKALDKCNEQILSHDNFEFLLPFRFHRQSLKKIEKERASLDGSNPKIILHGGFPKTGTTSLQFYLNKKRNHLASKGVIYPSNHNIDTFAPKHQWRVSCLLSENFKEIEEKVNSAISGSNKDDIILFSTEGIANHRFDYSHKAKVFLASLCERYNFKIVITLREHKSFLRSYYQQTLKVGLRSKRWTYGHTMSINQVFYNKWFMKHLDYYTLLSDMRNVCGEGNVDVLVFNRDAIGQMMDYLNIDYDEKEHIEIKNMSLSNRNIQSLTRINKLSLNIAMKKVLFSCMKVIDAQKKDSSPQNIDKTIIVALEREKRILKDVYNIAL